MTKDLCFTVNKDKCTKCGLCVRDCIAHVISQDKDGYPYAKNELACIGCQHCLAICPNAAISIFDKNPDLSGSISNFPSSIDMENLIKARRSCRKFKQENVSKETLDKLKNILNWTPTGVNFKDLHFAIVENKDTMVEIKEILYKKLKKILKFVPAKGHIASLKRAVLSDEDVIFRNAPHMIVVSVNKKAPCKEIDPIIALSYFELYAQTLGIGTLWCGYAYNTMPLSREVMHKFNIPKTHKLAYVMLFGYPDVKYRRAVQPESCNIIELK